MKKRGNVFYRENTGNEQLNNKQIATERVQLRRPCWHTRIQILGKCPPWDPSRQLNDSPLTAHNAKIT